MIPMSSNLSTFHHWKREETSPTDMGDADPTFTDMGTFLTAFYPQTSAETRATEGSTLVQTFLIVPINYNSFALGDHVGATTQDYKITEVKLYNTGVQCLVEEI